MTHPYDKLTHHYPVSGLLSFPVISSILIQTILVFGFQFGGYHILRHYYKFENICDFDDNEDPLPCHENTIFFLIAHFQYLIVALAFSVSKPFRQRIFTNWPLMIYLVLVFFYSIWITINCDDWSAKLFSIYDLKYKGDTEDEEGEEGEDSERRLEGEEEEEEGEELIEGGEKMKYYLLLIIGINMIVNIVIEWVVMKLVRNCYENKLIKDYKKEVEEEQLIEAQNNINSSENENVINEKEVQIFKYHRIYYYDRRIKMNKKNKEKKDKNEDNADIYTSNNKMHVVIYNDPQ